VVFLVGVASKVVALSLLTDGSGPILDQGMRPSTGGHAMSTRRNAKPGHHVPSPKSTVDKALGNEYGRNTEVRDCIFKTQSKPPEEPGWVGT
jgi:hypothetical protein